MNFIIKKPNNLIEARYNLSSCQSDIIDLILMKLDNDEKVEYVLGIKDYIELFDTGIKHVYDDFKKAVKEFKQHNPAFTLYNYNGEEEQDFFWFVKIKYLNEQGKILFKLDKEVKEIMLQIKNVTFYNVKYPLNMTSIYSKRIYYYLKRFEDTGIRMDKVEDLLSKLNCPNSYRKYSFFKIKVLKMAEKEINGHTDINFSYDEIKTGKKITNLKFYITSLKKDNSDKISDLKNIKNKVNINNLDNLINEIKCFITEPIGINDLKAILDASNNDVQIISDKYKIAKQQRNIDNLTAWLIKAIKKDYTLPIKIDKKNKFINYEQHDWDFDELEKLERAYIDEYLSKST